MDSAPKKLDAVDKWRARVLFRDPAPATDTWSKRMERQMAVLRVSFPFLTERQLRGKAWTACGLRSLMGELPRSGLSPEVKKEFTKRGKDIRFTMSPKPKIKKEPTASETKESELSKYSYKIDNFETEVLIPPNNIVSTTPSQTPLNSLNPTNLLPINKTEVLSTNSYESLKKRREKRKLKPKKVNFDTLENPSFINIVIPESSEVSWGANSRMKSKYPYFSQILNENPPIIQSQFSHIYSTETISECSTSTPSETNKNMSDLSINLSADHHYDPKPVEQCDITQQSQCHTPCTNEELQSSQKLNEFFNVDSGSTFFDCNLPTAPQNYWSQSMPNEEIVISESTPVKNANVEDSTIIFKSLVNTHTSDKKSLENQIIENSATPSMEKYADSLSQDGNVDFNSNKATVDSELTTEGSQNDNSINGIQTEGSPLIYSQNYSLPSTPQEPSTDHPLLSNLCCEYSKACSKEEYKPVPYVKSNNIIRKLKEDFDKIIPPEVSLIKYFEAEEKSFEQIQSEVHEKVNIIILGLEEVVSTETSKIDN